MTPQGEKNKFDLMGTGGGKHFQLWKKSQKGG